MQKWSTTGNASIARAAKPSRQRRNVDPPRLHRSRSTQNGMLSSCRNNARNGCGAWRTASRPLASARSSSARHSLSGMRENSSITASASGSVPRGAPHTSRREARAGGRRRRGRNSPTGRGTLLPSLAPRRWNSHNTCTPAIRLCRSFATGIHRQ